MKINSIEAIPLVKTYDLLDFMMILNLYCINIILKLILLIVIYINIMQPNHMTTVY